MKYLKYKKIKLKLSLYLLPLTNHPEIRGGIEIKIYPSLPMQFQMMKHQIYYYYLVPK